MSRPARIALWAGGGLLALAVLAVIVAILVVRTEWFRNYVRGKIIAYAESATGGTVEIDRFGFDWTHLRADVTNFVIHGTEAKPNPPLFRADTITLVMQIRPHFTHTLELESLDVKHPQVDVIVYPDGRTNVPAPKVKPTSNKTILENVVDLAINRFNIQDGFILFASQQANFHAQGEKFRTQLSYNLIGQTYDGQISMSPLYVQYDGDERVNLNVQLPVHFERDKIELKNAKINTPQSEVVVNGTMQHLIEPQTSAHVNARISLDEVKRAGGPNLPLDLRRKDVPKELTADVAFSMDKDRIRISTARMDLGQSDLEASGTLQDPAGNGSLEFNAKLAMNQIGRMLDQPSAQQLGTVQIGGNAKLTASAIQVDPLKLKALGGEFGGKASLEEMRRYRLAGNLRNFDIKRVISAVANERVGYAGTVSGPIEAQGDLKAKGTAGLLARAHLVIAPGRNGVPVSGRLNADYNGTTGSVDVGKSYLVLPSSRLDLSGSLNREIQVKLVSRNLNDFLPAMAMGSNTPPKEFPVHINKSGSAAFNGAVSGNLSAPRITGHLALANFTVEDRPFDRLAADVEASNSGAAIRNASLSRGALQATFAATVGLHQWKAEPYEPLNVTAQIQNADVADILALAGQKDQQFSGALNANARITGTIGNPRGSASLNVANGAAYDYRFDKIIANVDFSDQLVTISNAQVLAGTARVDLDGTYRHPRDSFETGHLQLKVASNQMALDQFRQVGRQKAALNGTAQINANITGDLVKEKGQAAFTLSNITADINARGIQYEGQNYGDFTATARTSGSVVDYRVNSDFAGSTIRASGQTRLAPEYPTTATLNVTNLPIERVLAIAGRKDLQFSGNLSADAKLSGTISDPNADANVHITNANLYEHVDSLQGHIIYTKREVSIPSLRVAAGSARAELAGAFTHPPNDFNTGDIKFNLTANQVQLSQFKKIQEFKSGLAGLVEAKANGEATLQNVQGKPPVLLRSLNANVAANQVRLNNQPFGDATLVAETRGSDLTFKLTSDFANAKIQGDGRMRLVDDYPIDAQVSFANVTYSSVRRWMGSATGGALTQPQVDGVVEGSATVSGPALKPEDLTASLRIPKLVLTATSRGALAPNSKQVTLQNQGPIVATLSRSVVKIDSARIVGPNTDISLSGTAVLQPKQDLNLDINANTNLSLLQSFNRDIYSSGNVVLRASIRGTLDDPNVNGEMRLQNAAFNLIDAPNGMSNANGVIVLSGKTATIQSLTAESGGGTISASGSATYAGGVANFKLAATADNVRVRYPESVSTVANASITLNGTSDNSTLAGAVTIMKIQFNPHSDFGSILSSAAPPVQTPAAPNPLLSGVHLQISVKTAPGVQFQTAMAQNVEAIADLRIRGTLDEPGVLGRINITEGQLIFFGTKYTVNQGSIAFYNPIRIEPILDIDLQTNVQGVDITLNVSGPADDMKLTHRSDPPLPFNQVLALLAAGKTPTDPTIAARQPAPPPQGLQEMGESAILQQVVANPVSSQLSRVFGITEFKIAPAFVTGSVLPQARLTLSQQITSKVNFTYITDLSNSNQQIIQIEWAVSPQWSAVATRDENGLFGIDFYYKKKFK